MSLGAVGVVWDCGRWRVGESRIKVCTGIEGDLRSLNMPDAQIELLSEPQYVW